MANENSNVVVDRAQSHWSDLWKKEDYWAIWLGFALLIAAICIFINGAPASYKETIDKSNAIMKVEAEKAPFKTIAYIQAQDAKKGVVGTNLPIAKEIKAFIASPGKWTDNPVKSMFTSQAEADAKNAANKEKAEAAKAKAESSFAAAQAAEKLAADAGYKDASLNTAAEAAIKDWTKAKADASKASAKAKPVNLFTTLPLLMVAFALFFGIGIFVMGQNLPKFLIGFVGLFVVVVIAMILGKQSTMAYYGIGVEPWGIMFGMIIANTIGTPQWMKPALQVEYFIKTGLVLLGAEILFDKIIAIGTAGIFVAWVVTPIVLITTFIFGQKVLKMASPTLNITISADMSVCGTSAAIAAAAACRAKKEELTLALGLSMTFTAIMMVALPAFIKYLGLPEVLGGAWIGGTVDSTGAVAAAGALLGPKAMYVAATIKMIQNVLIGVTAFGIAVYWCTSVEKTAGRETSLMEIWHRFPKFVIGFLTASIIFSIYSADLGPDLGTALINKGVIDGIEKGVRTWFFVLAFTAIGLSTNFRELPLLQGRQAPHPVRLRPVLQLGSDPPHGVCDVLSRLPRNHGEDLTDSSAHPASGCATSGKPGPGGGIARRFHLLIQKLTGPGSSRHPS